MHYNYSINAKEIIITGINQILITKNFKWLIIQIVLNLHLLSV